MTRHSLVRTLSATTYLISEGEWMAIATAQVFDLSHRPPGIKTERDAVLTGEVMREIDCVRHSRGQCHLCAEG